MISIESMPGNDKVIEMLEILLAKAREGRIGYIFAGVCEAPAKVTAGIAGAGELEPVAAELSRQVTAHLEAAALNRTLPPRDPGLDASHVCYNIANAPLGYDFIPWLIAAEMTRIREGAPKPLKVAFWAGRDGRTGLDLEGRRQMLEHVVRPALALIGAVEDAAALLGRCEEVYTTGPIAARALAGEAVPRLHTDKKGPEYQPPAVITLREADHWPHRNSNIDAWRKFAFYLRRQGERVIFVRDTAKARDRFPDFATSPEHSTDLHARMALYQGAKMNFFVSNGPGFLCVFSDAPWLQFDQPQPDGHPYAPDTPSFWRENMGVESGGQYPWSGPHQRLVWAPDTYENLVAAWEKSLGVRCEDSGRGPVSAPMTTPSVPAPARVRLAGQ